MAKMKSRVWLIVIICILVVALIAVIFIPLVVGNQKKDNYTEIEVKNSSLSLSVTASGNAKAFNQQVVVATTPGIIKSISVNEGDFLTKNRGVLKIGETLISCPMDGTITTIHTEVGKIVNVGDPLFTVSDLSKFEIQVYVNESKLNSLQIGNRTEISFTAIPDVTFGGVVSKISQDGSLSGGATLFAVKISIDDGENNKLLRSNMTGEVKIITKSLNNVNLLPVACVNYDGDKPFVYTKSNDSYVKSYLSLGASDGLIVEIKEGVTAGDKVYYEESSSSRLDQLMKFWG